MRNEIPPESGSRVTLTTPCHEEFYPSTQTINLDLRVVVHGSRKQTIGQEVSRGKCYFQCGVRIVDVYDHGNVACSQSRSLPLINVFIRDKGETLPKANTGGLRTVPGGESFSGCGGSHENCELK